MTLFTEGVDIDCGTNEENDSSNSERASTFLRSHLTFCHPILCFYAFRRGWEQMCISIGLT